MSAPPGGPGFCALQRAPEYFPPLPPGSRRVVKLYDPTDTYQDPYQTIVNPNDAITITPADLGGASYLDEALTFLVVDDDPLAPYDVAKRLGGTLVLLYHYDAGTDNFIPTRPTAIGSDYLQYPFTLPTRTELPQLRKFVVAIPKLTTIYCQATDPLSGRVVTSNSLTLLIKAPAYQIGPYTVRETLETPGSAIGAATYLTVDKLGQLNKKIPPYLLPGCIRGWRPFPQMASPVSVHPVFQPFPDVFLHRYTRVPAAFQPFSIRAFKHLQRPPEYFAPLRSGSRRRNFVF